MNRRLPTHTHTVPTTNSLFLLLVIMLLFQLIIYLWKWKHFKSYFMFTLFLLWIFPFIISISNKYFRMIIIWSIFSGLILYILKKSTKKPLNKKTPRHIYIYFYYLYKICNVLCITGYVLLMLDFFGFGVFLNLPWISSVSLMLLFYGLYYGVLSRDTAQLCVNNINNTLGFFNENGLPKRMIPSNICAVCNELLTYNKPSHRNTPVKRVTLLNHLKKPKIENNNKKNSPNNKQSNIQNVITNIDNVTGNVMDSFTRSLGSEGNEVKLSCGHYFHEFCIRGWVMIGKKSICPVCLEHVDTSKVFANPWHKQDRLWSQLLDLLRYLIVWNPIVAISSQIIFYVFNIQTEKTIVHTNFIQHGNHIHVG